MHRAYKIILTSSGVLLQFPLQAASQEHTDWESDLALLEGAACCDGGMILESKPFASGPSYSHQRG